MSNKWNKEIVLERLSYYSKQYKDVGFELASLSLDSYAEDLIDNNIPVKEGAKAVILCSEDTELNDDTFLDMEILNDNEE